MMVKLSKSFQGKINRRMQMEAARAIAGVVPDDELNEDYIIPTLFNKKVAARVAKGVMKAAREAGVARKSKR
jgi:malate dehydrogenase (oxaloacetate-decarboxylating)